MSQFDEIEHHLNCLIPRPPCSAIEQRLFGRTILERQRTPVSLPQRIWEGAVRGLAALKTALSLPEWHWLATPATAVAVFGLVTFNHPDRSFEGARAPFLADSLTVSSPQMASYYSSLLHSGRNGWRSATFEWTNVSHAVTNPGSIWQVAIATNQ